MSIEIIVEVMDHAPDTLTPGERFALLVLAEDARLPEREIKHDITDDYLLKRLRLSPKSWTNMRAELVKKKVLEKVGGGYSGAPSRYKIPILNEAMKSHPNGDPLAGERVTESVTQNTEKGHRTEAKRVTEGVTLTYITPVTPSTTPKAGEGEGSSTNHEQPADRTGQARALIAASPVAHHLGRAAHARLLTALDELLRLGWPEANLARRLAKAQPAVVHDLAGLLVSWLPEPAPYEPPAADRPAPAKPPHCGTCNPRTRFIDDTEQPYPCPACHPNSQKAAP